MFDPPHLLKNIRNNLLKHSFFTADSDVIKALYVKDQSFPLTMALKLTKKHTKISVFSKLRVNLPAQVLSHSVATGKAFLCQTGVFPESYMATFRFF